MEEIYGLIIITHYVWQYNHYSGAFKVYGLNFTFQVDSKTKASVMADKERPELYTEIDR